MDIMRRRREDIGGGTRLQVERVTEDTVKIEMELARTANGVSRVTETSAVTTTEM